MTSKSNRIQFSYFLLRYFSIGFGKPKAISYGLALLYGLFSTLRLNFDFMMKLLKWLKN